MSFRIPSFTLAGILSTVLCACLPFGPEHGDKFTRRYYPGYSIKDSLLTYAYASPSSPEDTTYFTRRILKVYPSPDSTLFFYERVYADDPGVADDEYSESLYFVLPNETQTFDLADSLPERAKVFFANSCFGACGVQKIKQADVQGNRLGPDKYRVEARVVYEIASGIFSSTATPPQDSLQLSGTFKRTNGAPEL